MIREVELPILHHAWSQQPELEAPSLTKVENRCGTNYLALIYYQQDTMAGFKLGYALNNQQFYSWVGGVKPEFRGQGIAKALLQYQENWCLEQQFHQIMVKSMNKFRPMLHMLIANGYHITNVENASEPDKVKIHFYKTLG